MAYYGSDLCGDTVLSDGRFSTPNELYNALLAVWRADTCTPRMRKDWSAAIFGRFPIFKEGNEMPLAYGLL